MSSMLKYRGYYGSIEVSTEDNCLFGKLQFIRALVNYEGETVAELEKAFQEELEKSASKESPLQKNLENAFQEAVDDYLNTCEDQNIKPEIPCKGSFNVRVGHDLHLAASVAARRQSISLNDLTRNALSEYLEHHP